MKIAIVKLSALGDIIHCMVVLQFIKNKYPDSIIDWVVEKRFQGAIEENPHINKIYTVNIKAENHKKSLSNFIKEIKRVRKLNKYDFVIDMQNLFKSAVLSWVIPSDKTIGLDWASAREGIASIFYGEKLTIDHSTNVVKRNVRIVAEALDIKISQTDIINKKPFLHFSHENKFNYISRDKPNIILIPGASLKTKVYPIEQYAAITKKINANFLILWASDSEKIMAKKIKSLSSKVLILEKLSLNKLKSLISQVELVIGGDTGPTHMAWALNIPSITLFGPTPGYRNTYRSDINKIIESESKVNPLKIDKYDFSIKNINYEDIAKMAENLLKLN